MDRNNIDKLASTPEDRVLLAKLWDKVQTGVRKNIMGSTCFLSPREQQLASCLFGQQEGLLSFGGYEDAERKMLIFLPDYLDDGVLWDEVSPIVCIRAAFYKTEAPSHRDFLGALMGAGVAREAVGDILVGAESCDFFVTAQIAPYILQNFESAGRTSLKLSAVPLSQARQPEQKITELRDTVASLRLDSIISAGFRISRGAAAGYIAAGRAAVDGLPCEKADKAVEEGCKISVRGLGKVRLQKVNGTTKKGRISVVIHRYE